VSTDDTTGSSGTQYQGQGDYYPSSNMNVCQIDFWFVTVGAGNYTAYIFEMSGTSLGTEVCHSETKANTSITTGAWTSFAITGDCNIVTGGTTKYGVVVLNGNSVELGDKAVSGGCTTQGGLGVWNGDKAIADNYMGDYDELFRLYGK
jgi:predicted CxxxxCH...CXXCH cytochrome family protein